MDRAGIPGPDSHNDDDGKQSREETEGSGHVLVYVFPQLREPTGRWWIDSLLQAVLKSLFLPCNARRQDFETAYPPETAIRIGEKDT